MRRFEIVINAVAGGVGYGPFWGSNNKLVLVLLEFEWQTVHR